MATLPIQRRFRRALLALPLLAAGGAGCVAPTPNDLVLIGQPGALRFALSTEDGLLALGGDDLAAGRIPLLYPYEGATILDDADVLQSTAELALLRPVSVKLEFSEFGTDGPHADEPLFVQTVDLDDPEHRPQMIAVELFEDGEYGDLLEVTATGHSAEDLASLFTGAGVYAFRDGRFLIVGILNGTVASNPEPGGWDEDLLPFVGLDVIAPLLPRTSNFFERRARVFRPDFEYGLTRTGEEAPRRRE